MVLPETAGRRGEGAGIGADFTAISELGR